MFLSFDMFLVAPGGRKNTHRRDAEIAEFEN
jgi:hypothetical protein